jgi:hypothetical protein
MTGQIFLSRARFWTSIDHATGTVIGETAILNSNVTIYLEELERQPGGAAQYVSMGEGI